MYIWTVGSCIFEVMPDTTNNFRQCICILNTWSSFSSKILPKMFDMYILLDFLSAQSTTYDFPIMLSSAIGGLKVYFVQIHIFYLPQIICPFLRMSLHLNLNLYQLNFFPFNGITIKLLFLFNFLLLPLFFSVFLLATMLFPTVFLRAYFEHNTSLLDEHSFNPSALQFHSHICIYLHIGICLELHNRLLFLLLFIFNI